MKKRLVNFELQRILCMYMIVVGHCLFHGRVTAKLGYGTANYLASYFIQSFSVVHVNCFVMIAGYFAIDREFKAQKLIQFWRQIVFYSAGIYLIYGCFAETSASDFVHAFLPISSKTYWFASVYMGMSLLMPFLRKLASNLSRRQYQYLLLILSVFMSVNHMIFRTDTYGNYLGRELPWFLFLALLAGYLKLHTKISQTYVKFDFTAYVACSLAILASVYLLVETHQEDIGYFLNYNSPLALLATLFFFCCAKNICWKETSFDSIILKISKATFGVYLIHDNYLIRYLVWDFFHASKVARTHWAVIYAAIIAVIVYAVCTILELLRQKLFAIAAPLYQKTPLYRKEQRWCQKLDEIFG